MKKAFIIINLIIVFILLIGAVSAQHTTASVYITPELTLTDKNNLNIKNEKENIAATNINHLFALCDLNTDGIVTISEIKNHINEYKNSKSKTAQAEINLMVDYYFNNQINSELKYK